MTTSRAEGAAPRPRRRTMLGGAAAVLVAGASVGPVVAARMVSSDAPAWAPDPDGPVHPPVAPDLRGAPAIDSPALAPIVRDDLGLDSYRLSETPGPGRIHGQVQTADGRSVPDLLVALIPREMEGDRVAFGLLRQRRRPDPVHDRTDPDGSFSFDRLPLGEYRIRLDRHPFGLVERYLTLDEEDPEQAFSPVVPAFGTVEGRVVSADGEPVVGATVLSVGVDAGDGTNPQWGRGFPEAERGTDAEGRFVLRGAPLGRNMIVAMDCDVGSMPVPVEVRSGEVSGGVTVVLDTAQPRKKGRIEATVRMLVEASPRGPRIQRLPDTSVGAGPLQVGDLIRTIDGEPTLFMSWQDFVWTLGGDPGTEVRLGVERAGGPMEVALARQPVGVARDWM